MIKWPRWYRVLLACRKVAEATGGLITSREVGEALIEDGFIDSWGTDRSSPRHVASAWIARLVYYRYLKRHSSDKEAGSVKWHRVYSLTDLGVHYRPGELMRQMYAETDSR